MTKRGTGSRRTCVIVLALCVAIFFGAASTLVFAENHNQITQEAAEMLPGEKNLESVDPVKTYEELVRAVDEAQVDRLTTIVIGNDIDLIRDIKIKKGQNITLVDDGKERIIFINNQKNSEKKGAFFVESGGRLTISTSQTNKDSLLTIDGTNAAKSGAGYGNLITSEGTFLLKGGTIKKDTCKATSGGTIAIRSTNALFHMTGGTISQNTFTNQYGGTVRIGMGATFILDGGSIVNNEVKPDGQINNAAVYVASDSDKDDQGRTTKFIMNGGEIAKNHGDFGGVFLGEPAYPDFYSKATMEMNGGRITGNTADRYGGGIMICGQARVTMNRGTISDNTALIGGGIAAYDLYLEFGNNQDHTAWKQFFPAELTMKGGAVKNNLAVVGEGPAEQDWGCGGGIYVASDNVKLHGGEIMDNKAERQGGGVYVGSVPYELFLYDTLVTGNSAGILGGGMWLCPTGTAESYVENGGAIFDNSSQGAGDDIASLPKTGNATLSLTNRLLGNWLVHWYKDGAIAQNSGPLGKPDENALRYPDEKKQVGGIVKSEEEIALKAIASKAGKDAAKVAKKLIISGNSAPRGGGIGTNGAVIFNKYSVKYPTVDVSVTKVWEENDTQHPESVTVHLLQDGHRIDTGQLEQQNGWTLTFSALPKYQDYGAEADGKAECIYTIEEEPIDGYVSKVTADKNNKYVLTLVNQREVNGNLKVSKVVEGTDIDRTKEFHFTVKVSDNRVNGTYGDMTFKNGVATFTLHHGESKTALGLPANQTYRVMEAEANRDGYVTTITGEIGTILKNQTMESVFINEKAGNPISGVYPYAGSSSQGVKAPEPGNLTFKNQRILTGGGKDPGGPTGSNTNITQTADNRSLLPWLLLLVLSEIGIIGMLVAHKLKKGRTRHDK